MKKNERSAEGKRMSATEIPDDLWGKILELGVNSSTFSYRDLCCISISCRRLCGLSRDDSLWHLLLSRDFPDYIDASSSSQSSTKFIYRTRFEREKERKVAAYRRAVLRKESEVSVWCQKVHEMEAQLLEEAGRLMAANVKFSNLQKIRQASVALNVWQPEIVRGSQQQLVEQNAVPVEGGLRSLEMEIKLCKQEITGVRRMLKEMRRRIDLTRKEIQSMKYHPLGDYKLICNGDQVSNEERKKLKTRSNFSEKSLAIHNKRAKLFHSELE